MCSSSTSYSQCASITSRPLFMSVAESIVILAPMSQVGCARASSGRARARRSAGQSRNGPPEAVSMRRRPSPCPRRRGTARAPSARSRSGAARPAAMAIGTVGSVRGRPRPRVHRASGMTRWPPATSVSLLAVATTLPASSAASTGPQADDAAGRDDDEVDVVPDGDPHQRVGRVDQRRAAGSAASRSPRRPRPRARRPRGRSRAAWSPSVAASRPAARATTSKAPGPAPR